MVMVMWFAWVMWGGGIFPRENTLEGHTGTHKSSFFPHKLVGEMNELEWPMLSYYVIYYEKFRKVMKRTEKEALTYKSMFLNVDDWWLTSSMPQQIFKLQILLNYAVIPENVISEDWL